MKNKEKYLDDIINYFIKTGAITKEGKFTKCKAIKCDDCKFNYPYRVCTKVTREWLEQEYKKSIIPSKNEKAILGCLNEKWKWVARNKNGELYVFQDKPFKDEYEWQVRPEVDQSSLFLFNCLFQFVKWEDEEPYSIEDLLNEN